MLCSIQFTMSLGLFSVSLSTGFDSLSESCKFILEKEYGATDSCWLHHFFRVIASVYNSVRIRQNLGFIDRDSRVRGDPVFSGKQP